MSKSTSKQLKQARKQIDAVTDQLDLDKRMLDMAGKAGLAKRKKVLGIPVSRKKPQWGRIATYGAVAAVGAVGSRVLSGGNDKDDEASSNGQAEAIAKAVERGAAKGAERGIKKAVAQDD